MELIPIFLKELEDETATTRKFLALVPTDKLDWQPHPKSMTIRSLAGHIAELPGWIAFALVSDELDFAATPYQQPVINNAQDLLALLEKNLTDAKEQLGKANEENLKENWTMRNGNTIYSVRTKAEVIRMSLNQMVHHRAQLGVFFRLLDIPLPGSYGPTADDKGF